MLYLDSLGSTSENVRIERSSEFRRQVSSYREMLDYSDKISVPEQLDGILREYQIYGFRWLKTLSAYGWAVFSRTIWDLERHCRQ